MVHSSCHAVPACFRPWPGNESERGGIGLSLDTVRDGFGVVWGMAMLDDTSLIITERADGSHRPVSVGPDVMATGQGGLSDVAVSPAFQPGD